MRTATPLRPAVASTPSTAFELGLAETYVRVYRRLRAVAARTASLQDADDVVHDAVVRALRRRESYRGEAAPSTWLHAIVRNAGFDARRHRQRAATVSLEEHHTPPNNVGASVLADRYALRVAFRKLAPVLRQVVVLYDVLGYTHGEIAAYLRIPVGTSKSRLSVGRQQLRRLLRDAPSMQRGNVLNHRDSKP